MVRNMAQVSFIIQKENFYLKDSGSKTSFKNEYRYSHRAILETTSHSKFGMTKLAETTRLVTVSSRLAPSLPTVESMSGLSSITTMRRLASSTLSHNGTPRQAATTTDLTCVTLLNYLNFLRSLFLNSLSFLLSEFN